MQTKLRKGEANKLEGVVRRAEAKAEALGSKRQEAEEARKQTAANAALALQRITALFDELAQHKAELADEIQLARKDVYQPIFDAASVCRVLRRVLCNPAATVGDAPGLVAQHIGLALEIGQEGELDVRFRLEFVEAKAKDGDQAQGVLGAWKRECRVLAYNPQGKWEARPGAQRFRLPNLNTGRSFLGAAVVLPSTVFVVGGGDRGVGRLDSVEELAQDEDYWDDWLTMPTPRECFGVCAVGSALVVVGGSPRDARVQCDLVEAVDTVTGADTTLPPFPRAVQGCAAVSVDGVVLVTGGWSSGYFLNDVWALDVGLPPDFARPLEWVAKPSMRGARCGHGAAAGGGCVFVCGGDGHSGTLKSCAMWPVGSRSWRSLPSLPTALRDVGCCYGGGNVFVAGGNYEAVRSLYALNVANKRWSLVGEMRCPRFGCAAVCVGRRVMVLGGDYGGFDGCETRSCEVFEF